MKIREVRPEDRDTVREISLSVSTHPDKCGRELLYHYCMYCDYYVRNEQDTSFLAVDEDGRAAGYILCADDYESYHDGMLEQYGDYAEQNGFGTYMVKEIAAYGELKYSYPAHLHIDVRAEYQGQGVGSMLMRHLIEVLKKKKVRGVMLGVRDDKTAANAFYRRHGFALLTHYRGVNVYGLNLSETE